MIPLAGGIFDWITTTSSNAETAEKAAAIAIAIAFVIYEAVRSRLNLARLIIAALAAGVALWVINNINVVQDRVKNDMGSSGPVVTQVHVPSSTAPREAGTAPGA